MRYLGLSIDFTLLYGLLIRHILVVAVAGLLASISGCGKSPYDDLAGAWRGEIKGQPFVVEFRPQEDAVLFDGRRGTMRLKEERDGRLVLEMTGPDGRTGEVMICRIDDGRTRLDIPNLGISVDIQRRE
ncbi:MAG TPA: hypothetical protein PKI11_02280 [Candidatus Hydrogenedentes bacterium]|nr:hypothetical protein [Candidatus Hydrogenedentota bacterium]